jgi:DsbC/DsbD-like thiol-disulfide interchange protein
VRLRLTLLFVAVASFCARADAVPLSSDWYEGQSNRARLIAGQASRDGETGLYAGLDIAMNTGWKTYWRTPGDAGGVPPELDFSGSRNLARVTVLYSAPHRIHDKAGDVLGYKDAVVFPVRIEASEPSKPIELRLKAAYGICKDICIPAEADLTLTVPPDVGPSGALSEALASVPSKDVRPGIDPTLASWKLDHGNGKPRLVLDIKTSSPQTADAFVEAQGGIFVPLPKRVNASDSAARFEVDLTNGVDIKELKGKALTVTMTDGKGQSETTISLE